MITTKYVLTSLALLFATIGYADLRLHEGTQIVFPDGSTMDSSAREAQEPFSTLRMVNTPLSAPTAFPINGGAVPEGKQLVILHVRGAAKLLLQSRLPAPDQNAAPLDLAVIAGSIEDFPDGSVAIESGRQPWISALYPFAVEGTHLISIHGYFRSSGGSGAAERQPFSAVRFGLNLEQSTPIEFPTGAYAVPAGKELVILKITGGFEGSDGFITFTPIPKFSGGFLQSRFPIPNDLLNPIDLLYIAPDEARGEYAVNFPDSAVAIAAGRQPWIDYSLSADPVDMPFAFSIHGYVRDAQP